jgi:hypothetical protein
MVPAMTAREKIARAAAVRMIEKVAPAAVRRGAGNPTGVAGRLASPGRERAGPRRAVAPRGGPRAVATT